jgi:hypothetical protein
VGISELAVQIPIQKSSSRNSHRPKQLLPSLQGPIGLEHVTRPLARSSSNDIRRMADSATAVYAPLELRSAAHCATRRFHDIMLKVGMEHEPAGWRGYATVYIPVWIATKRLKEKQSPLCRDFERTLDWARDKINRLTFASVKRNNEGCEALLFDTYFEQSLENLPFPVVRTHRDPEIFLIRAVYYNRAFQGLVSSGPSGAPQGSPSSPCPVTLPLWSYLLPQTMLDCLVAEVEALEAKRSSFTIKGYFQLDSGVIMSSNINVNIGFSSGGAPIVSTIFLMDVTEVPHAEIPLGIGTRITTLIQDDMVQAQADNDAAKIVDLLQSMLAKQHSPQAPTSTLGPGRCA